MKLPLHNTLYWGLLLPTSWLLKCYADWRVGATLDERRAHKTTDTILLTFDDYGTPEQVEAILDVLVRENIRAMFFLQGSWTEAHPEIVARISEAGHILGNHSYSHGDFLDMSDDVMEAEIVRGVAGPWFRPPRGRYNRSVRKIVERLGYAICYWTIDSDDWKGVSADYIVRKVLSGLHPGAVILFHIHAPHIVEALPGVIAGIRELGYEVSSFDEPLWGPAK